MNLASNPAQNREERLQEILLAYLEAVEAGHAPERSLFLTQHSEFAEDLTEFLAGRDEVEHLAAPLRKPSPGLPGDGSPLRRASGEDLGCIGDFQLKREIGRGGMGVVYEAEQISLKRRVALKVLPFAAALDPKQLARFKTEALAAAQLHHTNIVPVYAVGCERGVHYYAMQFIEGQSLSALIEQLRPSRTIAGKGESSSDSMTLRYAAAKGSNERHRAAQTITPANRTTEAPVRKQEHYRRVAALARTAAEALEHAHLIGVVHRDIKPANLLLDPRGNLWITDFGLAQMRGDANLTLSGELVGTLRYMSPEQASARPGMIDHRTDIYSLGVTLYEFLTLQPLFDGEGRQALLNQVIFEEPLAPRFWDNGIPIDLETIVLKAIAKLPGERYATAQEFANDLGRFLEDRPILAKRPTVVERVRKWGRRHKPVVISGFVFLGLALAGLAVATVLLAQETAKTHKAYDQERERAKEATAEKIKAEKNFKKARDAVDFFSRMSEEELPKSDGLRRVMLEFSLDYYQEFIDQCEDDPRLRAELTESRQRVQGILRELVALQGPVHFQLLQQKPVQQALKLDPDQLDEVTRFAREFNSQGVKTPMVKRPFSVSTVGLSASLQGPILAAAVAFPGRLSTAMSPNLIRKAPLEFANEVEEVLSELLAQDQRQRLHQIALQMKSRGPSGFADPEVSTLLRLTSEQKRLNREMHQKAHKDFDWGFAEFGMPKGGKGKGMGPPNFWLDYSQRKAKLLDSLQERSLPLLTRDQLARWRDLTGDPVQGLLYISASSPDNFGQPGFPNPFDFKPPKGPKGR